MMMMTRTMAYRAILLASVCATLALAQPPKPNGPPGPRPSGPAPPAGGGGGTGTSTCTGNCGLNLTSKYWVETNATHRIIYTNGIPSHSYYSSFPTGNVPNPNNVCEHFRRMAIPLAPELSASVTALDLGPVGILVTGGFLYNHLDGPTSSDNDLALPNRAISMDMCNGHPDQDCRYHYHKNPEGCIAGYENCIHVGYLADGFPVYSYCNVSGSRLRSCYSQIAGTAGSDTSHFSFNSSKKAAGECQLDEANGYCFTDRERGILSGSCRYGYVLTEDYPFVMPSIAGKVFYGLETLTALPQQPAATSLSTTSKPATTSRPTTRHPTTSGPTTLRPTTLRPTTLRPTTLRPTTRRPTTLRPTTRRPTTRRPTTRRP